MARSLSPVARATIENAHHALAHASYYDLLGLKRVATREEIQRAFDNLCGLLHPDLFHELDEPEMLKKLREVYGRLAEAYRVLCDADLRVAYHRALNEGQKRLDATQIGLIRRGDRKSSGPPAR